MVSPIRIGVMGARWPGRSHTEGLQGAKGAEVVAVADPDIKTRSAFIDTFGLMAEYNDYRVMLRKESLDAVVISLPTAMHYDAARHSLSADCHILCEKPPTTTAAEMKRIARTAEDKGLIFMFARQPRYGANVLAARKLVQKGTIGHIYHAESKWIRARGIPMGNRAWAMSKTRGGGVLLDLGIHMIDNAWFVMNCPQPVEAFAGLHTGFKHLAPKGLEYTADDNAIGMLRFDNGATLTFTVTFAMNTAGPVAEDVEGLVNPEWGEVKIYGKKGGIYVWGNKVITGLKKEVRVTPLKLPKNPLKAFHAQAREFIRAVREEDVPLNSPDQAIMLMQMLDALLKSGETRKSIRISPYKAP